MYSLNREPYQRDWFNGAVPLILQAKSDISAGVDGEISLFSNCFWGCGLGADYGTEAAYGYFWGHNYKIIDIANSIIKGANLLIESGNSDPSLLKDLSEAKTFRAHSILLSTGYLLIFILKLNLLHLKLHLIDQAKNRPRRRFSNKLEMIWNLQVKTLITLQLNLVDGLRGR